MKTTPKWTWCLDEDDEKVGIILSPEGVPTLKITSTRRGVATEARDVCEILNITQAYLIEGRR